MQNVVGVRFHEANKIYYFSPAGFEDIEVGEWVVVETSRGLEISRVVIAPHHVVNAELSETLKPITRMAYVEDIERMEMLRRQAIDDLVTIKSIVLRLNLPMTVVSATYNLDGTRLTVQFNPAGEQRVDLRDLLRELGSALSVQIQLRQIGPRDQAKAIGGYGICGRRLCCSSWLTAFPAISIKMAKEQNLPLNPAKISGQCGRLLCCLSYENDLYKQLKAELPRVGSLVSTPSGDARVVGMNALRQVVSLQLADFRVVEVPASAMAMDRGVVRIIEQPPEEVAAAVAVQAPAPVRTPKPPRPEPPAREQARRDASTRSQPERRQKLALDQRLSLPPADGSPVDAPPGSGSRPTSSPRQTGRPTQAHATPPHAAETPTEAQPAPPPDAPPDDAGRRKRRRRRGGSSRSSQ